ncbi:MAG: hypothetical protein BWY56_01788 [Acidobacteria bacterium ADurb.Bin340]|nr:MAG: hypothetical protein BWY56_01788 [Acidobacteria bacterium ADurb.Bin340]
MGRIGPFRIDVHLQRPQQLRPIRPGLQKHQRLGLAGHGQGEPAAGFVQVHLALDALQALGPQEEAPAAEGEASHRKAQRAERLHPRSRETSIHPGLEPGARKPQDQ